MHAQFIKLGNMETEVLKQLFQKIVRYLDNDQTYADQEWDIIVKAYSGADRYYHNLDHIKYMMGKALEVRHLISDWDPFAFSIYYHDIVYDTRRKDNEEKSAEVGQLAAANTGLGKVGWEKVHRQIMATKTHEWSEDEDCNYLTDIDLLVLGESPEVYQNYTVNIRKEYSRYLDFFYKMGRKKVLKHFLNMERIYKTDYFFERYEEQARENLEHELSGL